MVFEVSTYVLPTKAKRINPDLTLLGTPWSAPAWMKADKKLSAVRPHNTLLASRYLTYASYLAKVVRVFRRKKGGRKEHMNRKVRKIMITGKIQQNR